MTHVDPSRLKVAMDALAAAPEFFPSANETPNGVVEIRRTDRVGAAASAPTPGEAIKMAHDMTQRARAQSVLTALAEHDRQAKPEGDAIITAESLRLTADNISPRENIYPSGDIRKAADEIDRLNALVATRPHPTDNEFWLSGRRVGRAEGEMRLKEIAKAIDGFTHRFGAPGSAMLLELIRDLATRPLADAPSPPISSTNEAYHFQSEPTGSLSSAATQSSALAAAAAEAARESRPLIGALRSNPPTVGLTADEQEIVRKSLLASSEIVDPPPQSDTFVSETVDGARTEVRTGPMPTQCIHFPDPCRSVSSCITTGRCIRQAETVADQNVTAKAEALLAIPPGGNAPPLPGVPFTPEMREGLRITMRNLHWIMDGECSDRRRDEQAGALDAAFPPKRDGGGE